MRTRTWGPPNRPPWWMLPIKRCNHWAWVTWLDREWWSYGPTWHSEYGGDVEAYRARRKAHGSEMPDFAFPENARRFMHEDE